MSDTDYTLMIQQNTMLMQQLEEVLHILRQMQQSAAVEQDEYQEYLKLCYDRYRKGWAVS